MDGAGIFAGLEALGFEPIGQVDIYEKQVEKIAEEERERAEAEARKAVDHRLYLYDKKTTCPCCNKEFANKTIKQNGHMLVSQDSDLCKHYSTLFPHFYEATVCPHCGYAALSTDFETLDRARAKIVKEKISEKWNARTYPEVYTADTAIERYKLALYNGYTIGAKASTKAMICLKLCWVYRESGDEQNERMFMENALKGFQEAYIRETPPICGWDESTLQYVIGELNRRLGDEDEALRCFGRVITNKQSLERIRNKARDQKDLIIDGRRAAEVVSSSNPEPPDSDKSKPSFLKKLFH